MTKPKLNQLTFFTQGEDLPLFSGVSPKITLTPFVPAPPPPRQPMFDQLAPPALSPLTSAGSGIAGATPRRDDTPTP